MQKILKLDLHLSGVGTATGQWCLFKLCKVEKKDKKKGEVEKAEKEEEMEEEEEEEEEMLRLPVTISMNRSSEEGIIFLSEALVNFGWVQSFQSRDLRSTA